MKKLNAKEFRQKFIIEWLEKKGDVPVSTTACMEAYLKHRVEVARRFPSDPIKDGLISFWVMHEFDFVRGFDRGYEQALKEIEG